MATTFKAVLRVKLKTDTVGIINIRKTVDTKSTFYSLKIKCPVRYWNQKSGTVRKNPEIDYKSINKDLADKVYELEQYEGTPEFIPVVSKHSFIGFFEKYLKRFDNHGSKIKYQTVLKKLVSFLKDTGKSDLLYHEINTALLFDFRDYCRKNISLNSTTHYLKLVKQVVDSLIVQNEYHFPKHPFLGYDFKKTKLNKTALTVEELKKLLNLDLSNDEFLFDTRNKFSSQVFLQGMRISDLQLLRWNNIKHDVIEYRMFKTGKFMYVSMNDIVWSNLIHEFKKFCKRDNIQLIGIDKLEKELEELRQQRIEELKQEGFENNFDKVPETIGDAELINEIKRGELRLFASYKEAINLIANDRKLKNKFVFDFLDDEDFSDIKNNDFTNLSESQYKTLKNKSIVYNRHLKQLQATAKITTPLKSHLSRSSYASMLLNMEKDIYLISAALGHSSLAITEHYLTGFNTSRTAAMNNQLADVFK